MRQQSAFCVATGDGPAATCYSSTQSFTATRSNEPSSSTSTATAACGPSSICGATTITQSSVSQSFTGFFTFTTATTTAFATCVPLGSGRRRRSVREAASRSSWWAHHTDRSPAYARAARPARSSAVGSASILSRKCRRAGGAATTVARSPMPSAWAANKAAASSVRFPRSLVRSAHCVQSAARKAIASRPTALRARLCEAALSGLSPVSQRYLSFSILPCSRSVHTIPHGRAHTDAASFLTLLMVIWM